MLQIVIPMAGKGQRFVDAGYKTWKPYLPMPGGRVMIDMVLQNVLPNQLHGVSFLTRDIVGETSGAACTVLKVEDSIESWQPLMIVNSDQLVDIDINDFISFAEQFDACIMTFDEPNQDPRWSYVKTDNGKVIDVAEKDPISTEATVGIYYFRKAKTFFDAARIMISKNDTTNGEFYVCPAFKYIEEGDNVMTYKIKREQFHGLGIPTDYEAYLKGSAF